MNVGTAFPMLRRGWIGRIASAQGIFGRALRGSIVVAGTQAAASAVRLASNLVLARILFPADFGLMALVTVVIVGLQMLSDVGVAPSINHHARGDDPAFLDTAYSVNVARGAILWVMSCVVAYPMSVFYQAPQLAQLVPVAGLGMLIAGFTPTRVETAARHLQLVRVTLLDFGSYCVAVVSMVVLAVITHSVWSLAIGQVVGHIAKLVLLKLWLPGRSNHFAWDKDAVRDLVGYGKWIFLSTLCAFLVMQGDKMILGAYLKLDQLGIYNIGFWLGTFPMVMAVSVVSRIMIPLYRERPVAGAHDVAHDHKLRKLRFMLTGSIISLLALMAFLGVPLIHFLYREVYHQAGGIVVLVACIQMVATLGLTYDQAALAAGDSRGQFLVQALRAAVQSAGILTGIHYAGLYGALAGQGIALLVLHGALVLLARKHKAWDPVHDGLFLSSALVLSALAIVWNRAHIGI